MTVKLVWIWTHWKSYAASLLCNQWCLITSTTFAWMIVTMTMMGEDVWLWRVVPLLPVIIHRPLIITIATLGVLGGNVTVHIVTHCLASSSFVYDYMGVNLSSNDPRNHETCRSRSRSLGQFTRASLSTAWFPQGIMVIVLQATQRPATDFWKWPIWSQNWKCSKLGTGKLKYLLVTC